MSQNLKPEFCHTPFLIHIQGVMVNSLRCLFQNLLSCLIPNKKYLNIMYLSFQPCCFVCNYVVFQLATMLSTACNHIFQLSAIFSSLPPRLLACNHVSQFAITFSIFQPFFPAFNHAFHLAIPCFPACNHVSQLASICLALAKRMEYHLMESLILTLKENQIIK